MNQGKSLLCLVSLCMLFSSVQLHAAPSKLQQAQDQISQLETENRLLKERLQQLEQDLARLQGEVDEQNLNKAGDEISSEQTSN